MSHSVFKEYPSTMDIDEDRDKIKTDTNLVVFLKKDGSVSCDQAGLQNFLSI